jgi:hypothetical protein
MFDSTSTAKDAAQTTIPYIDAQAVSPGSGVWITGVGLYHKGYIGYGGFVGFSVTTFDFSTHLLPEVKGRNKASARLMSEELRYDFSIHRHKGQKITNIFFSLLSFHKLSKLHNFALYIYIYAPIF